MPRSFASCVLFEATQSELQSDLQMAAACAGLGGPRRGHTVKQGGLFLVLGWSHLMAEMCHAEARCCLFERC